jgi:oligopeptide/dipeptide ABC transporter ATP-binding protein
VSFRIKEAESIAIVGESNSGKSLFAMALLDLLSPKMQLSADGFEFDGENLLAMSATERHAFISSRASIIFQNPKASLNPSLSIRQQIDETLSFHGISEKSKRQIRIFELCYNVGIRQPERIIDTYPGELSEGDCQRIAIAIAIACSPKLLIADEPTSALDLRVQNQILRLLKKLNQRQNIALLMISNDFSLVNEDTDKIAVFYAGQLMEFGAATNVLSSPKHPYSAALLQSQPRLEAASLKQPLQCLRGQPPTADYLPIGCRLGPRCPKAMKICVKPPALYTIPNHGKVRCHLYNEDN